MLDIKKLEVVNKVDTSLSAKRAEDELNRMIALHTTKAENAKNLIKKYLLHIANGSEPRYIGEPNTGSGPKLYAEHSVIAAMLTELKKELEEDAPVDEQKQ